MNRRNILSSALGLGAVSMLPHEAAAGGQGVRPMVMGDRKYMVGLFEKIAVPVLDPMARGRLQSTWKPELPANWDGRNPKVAYLEAFGRLASGIAPWLALPDDASAEGRLRRKLRDDLLAGYVQSVDPSSPDQLLWEREPQVLVDAAYYANAFLRAPKLWAALDQRTRQRIVDRLKGTRRISPLQTNWLLFSAMIEVFLLSVGEEWDPLRIEGAVSKVLGWYVGDGWYSDGARFHFDYYGSFVIHAMLVEILEVATLNRSKFIGYGGFPSAGLLPQAVQRMQRYSEHLERLISPEGTFPPIGRSATYRTAAFQPLGLLAWRKKLPKSLSEGRVRAALTAAQHRIFDAPGNFSQQGYLTLGFAGHQPTMSDAYSNGGSMYIAAESFIALGLPESDSYWTATAESWTAKRAYAGQPIGRDGYVSY